MTGEGWGEGEIETSTLFEEARSGNRRALARLFTHLERSPKARQHIARLAYPESGIARVIGITGPPGAGKSTIVDGLIAEARREGRTVGVLAVDPTSPFTGGAVLGDRIRMQSHYQDPGVFIRSLATRGAAGGLNSVVYAGVKLLDAVGKDLVIVETVGVGQTELDVMGVVDLVVVVLVPEAGDTVQIMKAGLLEIADIFVVNKADRDGAGQIASALRSMIALDPRPPSQTPSILLTQANSGVGLGELYASVTAQLAAMSASGVLEGRRSRQARHEVAHALSIAVAEAATTLLEPGGPASDILDTVESGLIDPTSAVAEILSLGLISRALELGTQGARVAERPVVGIDLTSSESKSTACAVLDSSGALMALTKLLTDTEIIEFVREHRPAVVAIDSPLGLPRGMDCLEEAHDCESVHSFKGRQCERELMSAGIPLYFTTKRSIIKRMVYRAIALAERLRSCDGTEAATISPDVIEVYPYASKVALLGRKIPRKTTPQGLAFLTGALTALVPGLARTDVELDHDLLDAVTAAHTAHLYRNGQTMSFGIEEEARIHAPRGLSAP